MTRFATAVLATLIVMSVLAVPALAADPGSSNWVPMALPTGSWSDVSSPDGVHVWCVASNGEVAASTDSGATWSVTASGLSYALTLDFSDATHGWVTGVNRVRFSTDGGATWADSSAPVAGTEYNQVNADFVDAQHGWVWDDGGLSATTDGGATWQSRELPAAAREVQFLDAENGWTLWTADGYSASDRVSCTTDGGKTWTLRKSPPTIYDSFGQLAFADPLHGWVSTSAGAASTMDYTSDGGVTWVTVTTDQYLTQPVDMCAGDATHVWQTNSYLGGVSATDDCGLTWVTQPWGGAYGGYGQKLLVMGERGWILGTTEHLRTELNGMGDLHPPVTTVSGNRFFNTPTTFDFTATDVGSGVAETWYQLDSGAWSLGSSVLLTVPPDAAYNPIHHLYVSSRDAYGNWERPVDTVIGYDLVGPETTLTPRKKTMLGFWTNRTSYVTVRSYDELSGLDKLMVRRDGGTWRVRKDGFVCVTAALATHRNDGVHSIVAYGKDVLGNAGTMARGKVWIDTRKPTAKAPYVAHAKSGGAGSIKCEIADQRPCSGRCVLQIRVYTTAGRLVGILTPNVWFKSNRMITLKFKCPLRAGTYKFTVKGGDGAGNTSAAAHNAFIVGSGSGLLADGAPGAAPAPDAFLAWGSPDVSIDGLLTGHVLAR